MDLGRLGKKARNELMRNPKKSAILGVICLVALYFWLPLLRGSCPTHLILCCRAGQESIAREAWVKIPPLVEVAALYEVLASAGGALPEARVAGISLITAHLGDTAARKAIDDAQAETGLPVADVVRYGCEPLLDAILS